MNGGADGSEAYLLPRGDDESTTKDLLASSGCGYMKDSLDAGHSQQV